MVADAAWGRAQFAIGAAITTLYHGGYGYTNAHDVRAALAKGGLTGAPIELRQARVKFPDNLRNPSLIDNAINKAVEIKWDFNPDENVTGSAGEDLGLVDYVRLSFILFGNKISSFFFPLFHPYGSLCSRCDHCIPKNAGNRGHVRPLFGGIVHTVQIQAPRPEHRWNPRPAILEHAVAHTGGAHRIRHAG